MAKSGLITVIYSFCAKSPMSVPRASCTTFDRCISSSKHEENPGQCIYLLHPRALDICIVIKNAEP